MDTGDNTSASIRHQGDEMPEFAPVGNFCPNEVCADYSKRQSKGQKNIVKFGKSKAGRQRYKCKTCSSTFTETKGTIFYRRRAPAEEIIETLAFLAERSRVSSLAASKGTRKTPFWMGCAKRVNQNWTERVLV